MVFSPVSPVCCSATCLRAKWLNPPDHRFLWKINEMLTQGNSPITSSRASFPGSIPQQLGGLDSGNEVSTNLKNWIAVHVVVHCPSRTGNQTLEWSRTRQHCCWNWQVCLAASLTEELVEWRTRFQNETVHIYIIPICIPSTSGLEASSRCDQSMLSCETSKTGISYTHVYVHTYSTHPHTPWALSS